MSKPDLLTLPCHIMSCDYVVTIDLNIDYYSNDEKRKAEITRHQLKRAMNKLIHDHANGNHARKSCCCCHHVCECNL